MKKIKYKDRTYTYEHQKFKDKGLHLDNLVDAKCMKCDDKYKGDFPFGICPKCKKGYTYTDVDDNDHVVIL